MGRGIFNSWKQKVHGLKNEVKKHPGGTKGAIKGWFHSMKSNAKSLYHKHGEKHIHKLKGLYNKHASGHVNKLKGLYNKHGAHHVSKLRQKLSHHAHRLKEEQK